MAFNENFNFIFNPDTVTQKSPLDIAFENYKEIFPDTDDYDDINRFIWESVATEADRIAALEWGVANRRRYYEYPNIHPELVPGYWEQWHKDHPGFLA